MHSHIINEMIIVFKNDARRINHALKVYGFATAILGVEGVNEKMAQVISYAAILHDIGIVEAEKRHGSSAGKFQEIEGPPIAREILEKFSTPQEVIERVCYLIGNHHSYPKIDGIDFQILVEADFLVNIYEDEMAQNAIESIKKKYFKTMSGTKILDAIYKC